MKRFMIIELYRIDKYGERESNCGTIDNTVLSIERVQDGDSYRITSWNIFEKKEIAYEVPKNKYEIVINTFI